MNTVEPIKHDLALRRPLALGGPVVYWLVGATSEQRYDVARSADARGDGSLLLPDQAQEFHPARISLPNRVCRRTPRETARAAGRVRAGPCLAAVRLAARRPVGLLVPPDRARHLGKYRARRRLARPGAAAAAHLRRRRSVRQRDRGRLDGALRAQSRGFSGFRGRSRRRRQRDQHLVRRSRRA